jgi:hypothetical protein
MSIVMKRLAMIIAVGAALPLLVLLAAAAYVEAQVSPRGEN